MPNEQPPLLCLNRLREERPEKFTNDPGPERFFAELAPAPFSPLCELRHMARNLGLGKLYVKDESSFLGMGSFKARGALWAVAQICADKLGLRRPRLAELSSGLANLAQPLLLVSATDGNHGAAVSLAAKLFGLRAVIFMPHGSSAARVQAIEKHGATCIVTSENYDATVRLAAAYAERRNGILVQDTAWPGYEQIPDLIMAGYWSIAREAAEQLKGELPTHILLQAGVGSFAAAMIQAFNQLARRTSRKAPLYISMEPHNASCVYRSIEAGDGKMRTVDGSLETVMAGLACGQPSSLAWPILRAGLAAALSIPDEFARSGIRLLASPMPGDPAIISGESGAPGMGAIDYIMRKNPVWQKQLGLDKNARVLLISTEGAIDPASWEKIVGRKLETEGESRRQAGWMIPEKTRN